MVVFLELPDHVERKEMEEREVLLAMEGSQAFPVTVVKWVALVHQDAMEKLVVLDPLVLLELPAPQESKEREEREEDEESRVTLEPRDKLVHLEPMVTQEVPDPQVSLDPLDLQETLYVASSFIM